MKTKYTLILRYNNLIAYSSTILIRIAQNVFALYLPLGIKT